MFFVLSVLPHTVVTYSRRYRKLPIKKMIIIRTARIPIIKLETSTRVVADISLGDGSGPKAARYIAQQVRLSLLLTTDIKCFKLLLSGAPCLHVGLMLSLVSAKCLRHSQGKQPAVPPC
jgi:hypothetical protein